jgi:nucleoid DNA-binding protein
MNGFAPFKNQNILYYKRGDDVSLVGFGTFKAAESKARKGRNPRTGQETNNLN